MPTIYCPRFHSLPGEKAMETKLRMLANRPENLMKLKKHNSNMALSLVQLNQIIKSANNSEDVTLSKIGALGTKISDLLVMTINTYDFDPAPHKTGLLQMVTEIETEIKEDSCLKFYAGLNFGMNSVLSGFMGGASVYLVANLAPLLLITPPSMVILIIAVAVVAAALFIISAFTAYVDARFLAGNQLREIKAGIEYLCEYRKVVPVSSSLPALVEIDVENPETTLGSMIPS